ncbi:hypothetical protein [Nocardia sp. NPDC003183]
MDDEHTDRTRVAQRTTTARDGDDRSAAGSVDRLAEHDRRLGHQLFDAISDRHRHPVSSSGIAVEHTRTAYPAPRFVPRGAPPIAGAGRMTNNVVTHAFPNRPSAQASRHASLRERSADQLP